MYGMRGGLFTVISILRGVCYGRIVSSGRGRVAHLRTTDDKAGVTVSIPVRQWPVFGAICQITLVFVINCPTLILSRPLALCRATERTRNYRASTRENRWPFRIPAVLSSFHELALLGLASSPACGVTSLVYASRENRDNLLIEHCALPQAEPV